MDQKYVILRDTATVPSQIKRGMSSGTKTAGMIKSQPKIEVESISHQHLADLHKDPQVKSTTPVIATSLIKPFAKTTSGNGDAWGIAAVGADNSTYTGKGVKIAVLDTGIDAEHPAFTGVSLNVRDFTDTSAHDGNGHGTHCAGSIFGQDVEGRRIGIARGVKDALIGKVLNDAGAGSSEMIFQALQWALNERANVISMSLGFDFPGEVKQKVDQGWPAELATSQALESYRGNLRMFDAIMAMFRAHGAFNGTPVVIAAAGNESRREINSEYRIAASMPAAAEGVLSVAAVSQHQESYGIADFSNSYVRIAAPGVDVISAWPGGSLQSLDGTSMACPYVAGVAALWWEYSVNQGSSSLAATVSAHLISTARNLFSSQFNSGDYGSGLITAPK